MNDARNMLNLLLKHGADPHIRNGEGQTALHAAAFTGYTNVVTALLEKIPYTMDDFNKLDHHTLHSALAEGAFKIEDVCMDNLVSALVLSSNVPHKSSKPGSLQDGCF
jgi:ankyrin repeat protein